MNGKNVMVDPCENIYLSLITCHVTNYDKNCTILFVLIIILNSWVIGPFQKRKRKRKRKKRKKEKRWVDYWQFLVAEKLYRLRENPLKDSKTFDAFDQSRTILGTP